MSSVQPLHTAAAAPASSPVPTTTRVRGIVLMVLGTALALGCGTALWWWLQDLPAGTPGVAAQNDAATALLGGASALGAAFVIAGWQLYRQGRFDRRLGQAIIALAALFGAFLFYAKGLLH